MLGGLLFFLLIVSSVPVVLAAKIVVILLLQICTGREFYSKFVKSRSISVVEIASVGFSLGALIWLFFDQLFVALSLPHVGWLVPAVLAAITYVRGRSNTTRLKALMLPDAETAAWVVIATFVGLSGEWVWPFPFALLATAVALIRKSEKINKVVYDRVAIVVLAIAGTLTLVTRPTIWWITQTDTHFYQAISTSVAKWGFRDSILTSGYSLKYHWFPYAWTGMVSRISDAPDWVVLTRVGPLVATLCIVALVWTITLRLVENRNAAIVSVLIFAASPVFGDWSLSVSLAMFGSYSQHFATIWLLPILLWMIDVVRGALRAPWVLMLIFLLGLVGGKVSHAAGALVAVLGFELARFLQNRKARRSSVVESFVAVMTVLGSTLFLFGTGGSLTWRPASWVPYVQGDLYDFRGVKLMLATTILLLGMLSLVAVVLVRGMFLRNVFCSVYAGVFLAVIAGVVVSNFSSAPSNPNGLFFVHSPLIVAHSLIAAVLFSRRDPNFSAALIARRFTIPIFVGVCALLIVYFVPNLDSGSVLAVFIRTSRSLTPVIAFVLVVLLVPVIKRVAPISRVSIYPIVLVSLITISIGSYVAKTSTELPKNYRNFKNEGTSYLESVDMRALSDWFNENTTNSEIYASNYFCEGVACISVDYSRKALVAAVINRRSLMQSPWLAASYSSSGNENRSSDFSDRISTSISFATTPTASHITLLRNWSVDWYVVDLEVAPSNYWTNSDAKVYENGSYLVINLNKVKFN